MTHRNLILYCFYVIQLQYREIINPNYLDDDDRVLLGKAQAAEHRLLPSEIEMWKSAIWVCHTAQEVIDKATALMEKLLGENEDME